MFAYFKCGKSAALYIEFSKNLGLRPFFRIKTCNGETVLDIPYGQLIFTPPRKAMQKPKQRVKVEPTNDEQADKKIHAPPAGVAKN